VDECENPGFGPFPESGLCADVAADAEFDEFTAWLDREVAAGRNPFPPEPALAQGISVSLGAGDGIDQELLAAVCGTDCGDVGLGAQFGQGAAADALPPSPALAALTEETVVDVGSLSDNQLIGVLQAARRQENREAWKKVLVIAEFARRRAAEFEAAKARGVPVHCRPGQFPGEELAAELLLGPIQAAHAIDDATDLVTRLPATLGGMAAGLIDAARAGVIALHTRCLNPEHAALADEILAALAPELRLDQLEGKAAALEMKLDPEAVKARREHARRTRQRVEVRREESGNASVAGREMDTADALAAKAHIHALALRLRRAGLPGTLDQLRLLVFSDLTAGRDPLNRLTRAVAHDAAQDKAPAKPSSPDKVPAKPSNSAPPAPDPGGPREGTRNGDSQALGRQETQPNSTPEAGSTSVDGGATLDYDDGDWDDSADPIEHPCPPAPMPAVINLVVHAETLFGWDTAPSEAGEWGLLDADETRTIVAAASRHPATRWCFTLLARDGTAAAHGCSPGRHPWTPREQDGASAGQRTPTAAQAAQFATFLRSLNLTLEPIAKGGCDHAAAEPRYSPSRRLTHLVRARTATCDAPGCNARALHADLDHTIPYPDGPTDQCNLGPKCRRHHKAKQTPGWKVEQTEPGVIRWTLPSGRTHTTRPTVYD
jgi:hypothetical protein